MLFCKHALLNFFSLMFVRKLNCILIIIYLFLHCTLARVPASVCFNLSKGGFQAISGDTINNGEMNKCWWTNKASYRIYSINRPGRLLNFWTLRVGAYSRWALIRGWALIKFSPFSASEVCLFSNKAINANNKTRRSNKARFL